MDKIVDLEKRKEERKKREQLEQYRAKVAAVQKVMQCSSCHMRCAMCGFHVGGKDNAVERSTSHGLVLCADCNKEFQDFLAVTRKKKKSEVFWHNREWVDMWSAWVGYRKAVLAFMKSKEFKFLLEELDT